MKRHAKIFANNKDYVVEKKWNLYFVCRRAYFSNALQELLQDPDKGMKGEMLKMDKEKIDTTTVALTQTQGLSIVIKRYNIKNFWHGVKRALTRSRATKCWRNAHILLSHQINTPKPIAIVEKRFGWFKRESYYFYEFLPGEHAWDLFKKDSFTNLANFQLGNKLIQLINKMHAVRICHGDMKASNIIYYQEEPYFLDLDSTRLFRSLFLFKNKIQKERQRFLANWDNQEDIKRGFMEMFDKQSSL